MKEKKNKFVIARVTPALKEKFARKAKDRGKKESEILTELIQQYING